MPEPEFRDDPPPLFQRLFGRRPVAQLMEQHRLPPPTSVFAQLLALKVAQLPTDPEQTNRHKSFVIKLKDGRVLNVQRSWYPDRITITEAGKKKGTAVELEDDDFALVSREITRWFDRNEAQLRINEDAANEDTALSFLEGMI